MVPDRGRNTAEGAGTMKQKEMPAMEFWRKYNMLCDSHKYSCEGCPISEQKPVLMGCVAWMRRNPKKAIQIMDEWEGEE